MTCLGEALYCLLGASCESPYNVHNSECDPSNNLALCLFDGGDCCSSTCESSTSIFTGSVPKSCVGNDFDCIAQFEFGLCDLVEAFPYIINKQATKDAIDAVNFCGGFSGSEECVFDQITQARQISFTPVPAGLCDRDIRCFQVCVDFFCCCFA